MKKTKSLPLVVAVLACVGLQTVSHAIRIDLPTLFSEDTLFYLEIPSVPQLQEDWTNSPFHALYQREEVKKFVDALLATLQEDEGIKEGWTGLEDFLNDEDDQAILDGLLSGRIAFGLSPFDLLAMFRKPPMTEEPVTGETGAPRIWMIFDYESDDLYSKLMKDMEEEEEEYIEYKDFYVILAGEFAVAYNEDIVGVTNNEETARAFVDRYLGESSQLSLADQETFQTGFLRIHQASELFYYLDLTFLSELATQAMEDFEPVILPLVQQGQLAPPSTILEALGLDALKGLFASIDTDPYELRLKTLLLHESNTGFFSKMFERYGHSLPDTRFLGEDLSQATASTFDISGMLHDIEDLVATVSPMSGQMYAMQKTEFEQVLSIRMEEAFIGNFSGSFYVAAGNTPNTAAAGMTEQMPELASYFDQGNAFVLGINDRISLEAFIDSILASFDRSGKILKQDFLGVSNYQVSTPVPSPGPALFISDQHLVLEQSNPDFGKLVVSMMQNPRKPIFARRDIRDALNDLPPDPIGVTYNDAEKLLEFASRMISGTLKAINNDTTATLDGETSEKPELPEMPIIKDFGFFTLVNTYKETNNLYQEGILRPKSN